MFLQLKILKLDESIPKYATNLAFLSRAKKEDEESLKLFILSCSQPNEQTIYFLNIINPEKIPTIIH